MDHVTFSRRGGKARSPAKTVANRAKAAAYWKTIRQGAAPEARLSPSAIARLLAPYCRDNHISRLEVFGSIVRGQPRPGSDVDLLACFSRTPGLHFFRMEQDMSAILGAPVHLLTRHAVEEMSNPYRKKSILADAQVIFRA